MDHGDQCGHLLQLILSSPGQVSCLAPHFTPNCADIPTFIDLYSRLSQMYRQYGKSIAFIVLSKVNIVVIFVWQFPVAIQDIIF